MIVDTKTPHWVANKKKPRWVGDEPEDAGFATMIAIAVGGVAFFVSMLITMALDALVLGGPGTDGVNEMTGREVLPFLTIPPVVGFLGSLFYTQIAPMLFKRTYFSNQYHRVAYLEFWSLSPEGRVHAQDAYDALAAFDNPEYLHYTPSSTSLNSVFTEAADIWDKTYAVVRARDENSRIELYTDRLHNAREALESLKD